MNQRRMDPNRWSRLRCSLSSALASKQVRHYGFAFVLAVLSAVLLHSGFRKGGLWDGSRFNDFKAYHQAAESVVKGDLVAAYSHSAKPYQYPPTLATLLVPLGLVPYRVALFVWVVGALVLLLWTFRILDTVLCPPVRGIDKFFGFLMIYRLIESDFANTNANVLVLAVVVSGFFLERRARSAWGGSLVALAACIKVAPMLVLPWMLYRRRWRMLGGFVAGLVVWGVFVPGTILGPRQFADSFKTWYGGLLAPMNVAEEEYAEEPPGNYVPGQSVRSLAHHLLRSTDATAHDKEIVRMNVVDLPKSRVDLIYLCVAVIVLSGVMLVFWVRGVGKTWSGAEIATALLLTALLSPLARKAHFVVLLPAAAFGFAVVRNASGRSRWILGSVWVLAFLLIVGTSPSLLGKWLSVRLMGLCPLSLAASLLLGLCLVPVIAPEKPCAEPARVASQSDGESEAASA